MDYIWSPWRMKYIRRLDTPGGCIFCDAVEPAEGEDHLVVVRAEHAFVILNRYPYTSGHIMVVPFAHINAFEKMDNETCSEIMKLLRQGIQAIDGVYQPDGYNMGANLGESAGAGIADHIHFHLVPRWDGDTNFMSSVSFTRVLPEDLTETQRRLKEAWPKTASDKK